MTQLLQNPQQNVKETQKYHFQYQEETDFTKKPTSFIYLRCEKERSFLVLPSFSPGLVNAAVC